MKKELCQLKKEMKQKLNMMQSAATERVAKAQYTMAKNGAQREDKAMVAA